MLLVVIGIVLLVVTLIGFFFMRNARNELQDMVAAEKLPVSELETLRGASDEVGGQGGFRKKSAVVGAAHPRPEGPLISEFSKTECVWYRYRVERDYEQIHYRGNDRQEVRKHTEKVAEHTSWEGYALRDDDGVLIGVDPNGTRPDGAEEVLNRYEPARSDLPDLFGIRLPRLFDSGGTIGYRYKEWVIRPERRLYILGEVHDKIGPLVIGKPEQGGHFIISTRSEEELRKNRQQVHQVFKIGTLIVGPVGLALTIIGTVLHFVH
jgi:hypothetical protein